MKLSTGLKSGIILASLGLFLIVLNFTGFNKTIKNFFYLISSPIQKTLWQTGAGISDFFEAISQSNNLKKENEELKIKIQTLTGEMSLLQESREENETLREALFIGLEKDFKLSLADIFGKDITQDFILIDKGEKDGIFKNLPVITQQKILVGKISQVYEKFSKVQLLTNKDFSSDGKISGKEIYGVLSGKNNLRLSFDFIPSEAEIKIGEAVVTTKISGVFPEGILVGAIKEVQKSDVKSFQTAEITSAFNFKEVKSVFIVTEW